ncbi:MAG: F0F1 ATP synthase subunit gamma [Actinomycetota bacterium]
MVLVYTRFISAGSQEVVLRPLVPLERDVLAGGDGKPGADGLSADYEFEPDPSTILETLIPRYIEARVYTSTTLSTAPLAYNDTTCSPISLALAYAGASEKPLNA